jgi:hypothetical protein
VEPAEYGAANPSADKPSAIIPLTDAEQLVVSALKSGNAMSAKEIGQGLTRGKKNAPSPTSISKMKNSRAMIQRGFSHRPGAGYYLQKQAEI